jgi:hypothetical protein
MLYDSSENMVKGSILKNNLMSTIEREDNYILYGYILLSVQKLHVFEMHSELTLYVGGLDRLYAVMWECHRIF